MPESVQGWFALVSRSSRSYCICGVFRFAVFVALYLSWSVHSLIRALVDALDERRGFLLREGGGRAMVVASGMQIGGNGS